MNLEREYLPTTRHDITMASFHAHFNIRREVAQSVNLERLTNAAKNEENLHINELSIDTNGSCDIVQEAKVSSTHIPHGSIAVKRSTIKSLTIKDILGTIE